MQTLLSRTMSGLPSGDYFVPRVPAYQSQFADRTRVSDFLDVPSSVSSDSVWQAFGFAQLEEYAFWAPRLCGAICLWMALDALGARKSRSIAKLTYEAVGLGGYEVQTDRGWLYAPLLELSRRNGLCGDIFSDLEGDALCKLVLEGAISIASVNPKVVRGDVQTASAADRRGHLVLVVGFRWSGNAWDGIYIHNPSGRTPAMQSRAYIPREQFSQSFGGRGLTFWRDRVD